MWPWARARQLQRRHSAARPWSVTPDLSVKVSSGRPDKRVLTAGSMDERQPTSTTCYSWHTVQPWATEECVRLQLKRLVDSLIDRKLITTSFSSFPGSQMWFFSGIIGWRKNSTPLFKNISGVVSFNKERKKSCDLRCHSHMTHGRSLIRFKVTCVCLTHPPPKPPSCVLALYTTSPDLFFNIRTKNDA